MLTTRNLKTLLTFGGGMTKNKLRRLNGRRWKYPLSLERLYTSAISRYLKKRWVEYMNMETKMLVPRMDGVEDLEPKPGETGPALGAIVSIAEDIDEFNSKELQAFQKIAVGEAFAESEIWVKDVLNKWSKEQVSLITKATNDMRDAVARRVRDGVKKGLLAKDITKQVLAEMPGISFRRARVIARDQTSKLNAELSQRRMTEAGLETYKWETSLDERVRGNPSGKYPFAKLSHWVMQGKICRWDDPTLCINSKGEWEKRPTNAVYLHPGQDIMCRCVALPNWNELENIEGVEILPAVEIPEPPKVKKKWTKEEISAALASGVKPDEMSSAYWSKLNKKQKATKDEKIPTLENLDKKIDEVIKNPRYSKFTESDRKKFAENLTKLFENADFGMNVPRLDSNGNDVLDAIFSSYFKNQIETGTGKGMVDLEERKIASRELFGTNLEKAKPKDFEKYGFLMDKDMIKQAESGIAGQYWDHGDGVQIRFKKNKVNVTFTLYDSLSSGFAPSKVSNPKLTSAYGWGVDAVTKMTDFKDVVKATHDIASGYIELQYHGDLTLDMIESIYIPWETKQKIPTAVIEKMRATGAKLFSATVDSQGVAEELFEF